jgi:hypothetical protein
MEPLVESRLKEETPPQRGFRTVGLLDSDAGETPTLPAHAGETETEEQ